MKYGNFVARIQAATTADEIDLILQAAAVCAIKQFCALRGIAIYRTETNVLINWNHDVSDAKIQEEVRSLQRQQEERENLSQGFRQYVRNNISPFNEILLSDEERQDNLS